MVRKIRIIHKIRHLVSRVTARPTLKRAIRPPAKRVVTRPEKAPSDLPENPVRGIPHPDYQDKPRGDNGWRNT